MQRYGPDLNELKTFMTVEVCSDCSSAHSLTLSVTHTHTHHQLQWKSLIDWTVFLSSSDMAASFLTAPICLFTSVLLFVVVGKVVKNKNRFCGW